MATVGRHVTIGGNFRIRGDTGGPMPRIGDEAIICADSVVAGPVDIGSRAIIAANSFLAFSVLGDAVVGRVPTPVLQALRPQWQGTPGDL